MLPEVDQFQRLIVNFQRKDCHGRLEVHLTLTCWCSSTRRYQIWKPTKNKLIKGKFEKIFSSYPGDETVTYVLRHALIFLQFFEEDITVKMANILQVAENYTLFSLQSCWHIGWLFHRFIKLGQCQLQVLVKIELIYSVIGKRIINDNGSRVGNESTEDVAMWVRTLT